MLLETAKSYLFCCFAGPKDAALHHLPRSGMAWTSCGPLPARNAYRSVCGTRVLFAVFGRRHGLLPGTLVLETATDCCRLTGRRRAAPLTSSK